VSRSARTRVSPIASPDGQKNLLAAGFFTRGGTGTFRRPGAAPRTRRAAAELRACCVTTAVAPTAAGALADLTAQQREIVILASGGLTNSEIADRLFLSLRTAASHQTCISRIGRSASARPGCQQTR